MDIKNSHYCAECSQECKDNGFERHYLMKPTPARKRCNAWYEAHDKPFNQQIRASVSESRAKNPRNSEADPVFTKKRRDAEMMREIKAIDEELGL